MNPFPVSVEGKMQEIRATSVNFLDSFQIAYCEYLDCYCFESNKAMPRFEINSDSVLYANRLEPHRSDLVICRPLNDSNRVFVGRLIGKKGAEVFLELSDGLAFLLFSNALLVVTGIA